MKLKNILIVGGSNRNVGKTEFICKLIARLSKMHPVLALKVSGVTPSYAEAAENGTVKRIDTWLFEETRTDGKKDTSRMLRAGAVRVMYLHAEDDVLQERFTQFLQHVPDNTPIICESNSLGKKIKPALSVVIKDPTQPVKKRAIAQLTAADLVIETDGTFQFQEIQSLSFSGIDGWRLMV